MVLLQGPTGWRFPVISYKRGTPVQEVVLVCGVDF